MGAMIGWFCPVSGIYEALELRDKDPKAYMGKGVFKVPPQPVISRPFCADCGHVLHLFTCHRLWRM
jgi:hypothetical protein